MSAPKCTAYAEDLFEAMTSDGVVVEGIRVDEILECAVFLDPCVAHNAWKSAMADVHIVATVEVHRSCNQERLLSDGGAKYGAFQVDLRGCSRSRYGWIIQLRKVTP